MRTTTTSATSASTNSASPNSNVRTSASASPNSASASTNSTSASANSPSSTALRVFDLGAGTLSMLPVVAAAAAEGGYTAVDYNAFDADR